LVSVTKYRRGALNDNLLAWLAGDFAKVCETMQAKLLACSGEDDHVHLLVEYPPKLSVTALVNALKSTSSRLLRKERPDLASRYWKGVLWTPSYFAASAGGAPLTVLRRYIEQQRLDGSAVQPSPP
jgi:putative transposase